MPRKEDLSKLLEIIDKIIKDENDNWFSTQLLNKIGSSVDLKNISEHSVIKEIHEYCIEDVLKTQATEFYKDLPLEDINEVLVADFVKMERQRREGDFINFSLAMYQQIENIVNHLFDSKNIKDRFELDKNNELIEYTNSVTKEKKLFSIRGYNTETKDYDIILPPNIHSLIVGVNYSVNWNIWNAKFKAILYYYFFDCKPPNSFNFNNTFRHGKAIAEIRNMSHRGSPPRPGQKEVQLKYTENKSSSYLYFYSFLHNFISKLSENLSKKMESKVVIKSTGTPKSTNLVTAKSDKKVNIKLTGQVIDLTKFKK